MQSVEIARLTRQCQAILARLQQGTATNRELVDISIKYTGRISELRQRGWDIKVESRDHATGLTTYRLHTRTVTQLEMW